MTTRDRSVVMVLGLVALLAAAWFLLLSPKNDDLTALKEQISTAQTRLEAARTSAQSATAAKAGYAADYKAVASLGKAVPIEDDVPSLVYQLQQASESTKVAFASIKLSGGAQAAAPAAPATATPAGQAAGLASEQKKDGDTAAAPAPAAAALPAAQTAFAGLPPGASVGAAGFPTMPFDFEFGTVFGNLEKLLRKIDGFTKVRGDQVDVSGRLLTVDGFSLEGFPNMKASIHATAFLVPAEQAAAGTAQGPSTTVSTTATTTQTTGAPATPVAAATGVTP